MRAFLIGRRAVVWAGIILMLAIWGSEPVQSDDSASSSVVFFEDFRDLSAWEPLHFRDIERHSSYEAVRIEGRSVLRAVSNSSASAIVSRKRFNVYRHPVISWRWRVEQVYDKGDARKKEGDDYPLRVYVLFAYDAEKAGWWKQMKYGAYKKMYGEYPPDSTLNYIFANKEYQERVLTNTYTGRAKMFPLRQGPERTGEWLWESRNILRDYRLAFGEDPPVEARVAIMNDSDNTGESSVSYLDCLRIDQTGTNASRSCRLNPC